MHIPNLDWVSSEREELRFARDADDNVIAIPREAQPEPKHVRSEPGDIPDAATLFSLVFVTADSPSPTQMGGEGGGNLGGGNGGGNGGGDGGQAQATMGAAAEQTGASQQEPTVHEPVPVQTQQQTQQQPTPTPTPTHTPKPEASTPTKHKTTAAAAQTTQAAAVPTSIPNVANGALATAAPTQSAQPQAQQQGMSTGAKAGIAIGVLLGIGLLAAIAFFVIRSFKKKKEQAEDEKFNPFHDSAAPPPAQRGYTPPPVAPMADFRPSTSGTQNPFNAPSAQVSTRDLTAPATPLAPPVNPFGNQAALVSQSSFNGSIPIGDETNDMTPPTPASMHAEKAPIGAALGGAAAGAALGAGIGAMSHNRNAPKALELDAARPAPPFANQGVPQSPAASAYSFTSQSGAVAAAAVAGAPAPAASNVHRVQLDFVPSMHDEMELKQGELVRMLHEYDDGWALCTKFDKSSRGVCPRTCLSQKPLQPRGRNGPPPPRGPGGPAGPGPRGPGAPPRSASPALSQRTMPRPQGPPSRSASPSPALMAGAPPAAPAPAPAMAPSMAPGGAPPGMQNWPAKPTNTNLGSWPAQPVNAFAQPPRSMSPGPYGGGPQQYQQQAQRPNGPAKRRSQSVGGGINMPKPLSVNSDEFALPIQGTPQASPVNRKPVPMPMPGA